MKIQTKKNKKVYLRLLFQKINLNAFTTFELLIVIALVSIIGATSIPFLSRFLTQNATGDTYNRLLGEFRKAQTYAMMGKQNGPWGVYYGTVGGAKKVILYQGTSYATHTNTTFDESYSVSPNVTITGLTDINFAQVSGTPNTSANITIKGTTSNTTRSIQINTQGIVNYAMAGPTYTPGPPTATPTNTPTPTAIPTPPAPTGLIATGGNGQIILNWNAIGGDYYYIYEKNVTLGETTFNKLPFPVTTNTFTYSPVTNGQLYTFEVSAIDTNGTEGPLSSPASAAGIAPTATPTPLPTATPTPLPTATPTSLPTATPTPSTFTLSGTVYNDVNGNGFQDTGDAGFSGATVKLNTGPTTTTNASGFYSFTGLVAGTYTVTLTAAGYHATTSNPVTQPVSGDTSLNFGIQVNPTATPIPPTATPRPTATPTPQPPTATPTPLPQPIAIDATTSSTSMSWSHTTANHTNRIIIVGIGDGGGATSVTYGGQALTKIGQLCAGSGECISMWYRINPLTGTNTVSINDSGGIWGGGASTYYNVNQSTPLGTYAQALSSSLTVSSTNTTQLVVDNAIVNAGFVPSITPGTGQTKTWGTGGLGIPVGGSYKAAGSTSTTMSWSGVSGEWNLQAVALNRAP